MTIKSIDKDACKSCQLRIEDRCPVMESCPTDVIRVDERKQPYIAYPDDCDSCFLCQLDCPHGAVHVSAEISLPLLPY